MHYWKLLRQPISLCLWAGQVLSASGDRLYSLAVMWLALSLTGSAQAMASTVLAESVAVSAIGLVGGALVDGWDKLCVTILVDLIRSALVLTIPLVYWLGALNVWWLVGVGTSMGALAALFEPAFDGMLPLLAPAESLSSLAGLMDTPSRFARLLGPGIAGALLAWIPVTGFFVLDALSFVCSAVSLMVVRRWHSQVHHRTPRRRQNFRTDVAVGFRIVAGDWPLASVCLMDAVGNALFVAYSLGAVLLATEQFHAGLAGYGWLIGAYGIGSLVGNLVVGNFKLQTWMWVLSITGWSGIGLGFIILGFAPTLSIALLGIGVSGACGAVAHVSRTTLVALRAPKHHLAKVYSLNQIVVTLCSAVGTVIVGRLLDLVPAGAVVTGAGGAMLLANSVVLAFRWRRSPARDRNGESANV